MLNLYSTLTRSKKKFKPIEQGKVKIFACGPSVYQRPHIGNYRTFLYEDLLIKYLKYSGYKVKHRIILTDIEDKSLIEAKKRHKNVDDLTENVAEIFFREAELLKIELPSPVPRSSTSVRQSASLIKMLLEKGFAYRHKGDIFFDALKFKGFGKLFGLDISRWPKNKVHFKKDTYNGRRWNLGDFILWHGYKEGDAAAWDSKIGKGRPSWNIQDPAVITQQLGYEIDINCGGIDNIYRHHDYTIAIIESISGLEYANYYLHGEHLIVNGKSMSKSRKNILYPEDVFKNRNKFRTYKPYHLRFFLLYTHYRKKLNYTKEKFIKSSQYIDNIRDTISDLLDPKDLTNPKEQNAASAAELSKLISSITDVFEKNMNDDLGFGEAIDGLSQILNKLKKIKNRYGIDLNNHNRLGRILNRMDSVAGIFF